MDAILDDVTDPSNALTHFIIQHMDTLPKYGHKTLDVRYVYPAMVVNLAF